MSGPFEQELKDAFALFDLDKDGKITEKELASVMKKLGSFTSDADVREMIREVDLDKNGTIDFAEFVVMMTKNQRKLDHGVCAVECALFFSFFFYFCTKFAFFFFVDKELMGAFKVFDKNGDGKINAAEVFAAMRELGDVKTLFL